MSIGIVATQMAVIFAMMWIGYVMGKKEKITKGTTEGLSFIIANIANPALMLSGALNKSGSVPIKSMMYMALISVILDVFLIILGIFMGHIIRAPKEQKCFYNLMTVFGNSGMIGIPVVSAVLGTDALVYMGIFNVFYMFLMYTYGVGVLEHECSGRAKIDIKRCIGNIGSIVSLISIILFAWDFSIPYVVTETANYIGSSTCFLSILVIGVSMSKAPFSSIFGNLRLYVFTLIRHLAVPGLLLLLLRRFLSDTLVINVCVLILCMPVANMPAILAEERKMDSTLLSEGIILTTILSLVFIPLITVMT